MSLPAAQKDISVHPAQTSVVDPVNPAAVSQDVDRKLVLYGVVEAFRNGRLPTNTQIDKALQYILDHSPVDVHKLSPEGRKLVQDTKDIIGTARVVVQEKNADQLLQNFIWHTREVDSQKLKYNGLNEGLPVESSKSDSEKAVQHLRTLLSIILTNSEVRKLLSDFSVIGADLLSKGAAHLARTIAPTDEQLRNVDQSGPDDEFITAGGRPAGPGETPVPELSVPGTSKTLQRHPKENEARIVDADGTKEGVGEASQQAQGQYSELKDRAGQISAEADHKVKDYADTDSPQEAEEKKMGMREKMRQMGHNVREGISDRIPQQRKDEAHDRLERGRHMLAEEYFPAERRDQFIFRGKKVIIECQKRDDYQEAIRWFLDHLKQYAEETSRGVTKTGGQYAQGVSEESTFKVAINELRTLLERFANYKSLDLIVDAINALIDDTRRDKGLREWFESVDVYIRKVLLEPGYVLEPACNDQGNRLRETGKHFYDDKYRSHFDNLFDSVGSWFKAMGEDPLNHQFGEDWARLTRDLLFDSEGSLKFKPHLWNDIRKVILPQLIEQVRYLPIPRIEYTDDSLDLVVENLTLQGRNLFPNIIEMEAHNFIKFSPYDAITDDHNEHMTLRLHQVQADMRDVAFYYRKKTGIPKMSDSGLADVLLGGEGLNAVIHLVSSKHDRSSVFRVQDVHVKVNTLKFAIRDSKHDFLYKTLRPLATGLIKRQIQKAIKDALITGFEYIDGQLVAVRDRMESAQVTEGTSRTDVLKDLFKRKKETTEPGIKPGEYKSQFKIVANKRESLLSHEGNPAGWVNRTAEKEEMAKHGSEWRSDAFNIV
ncbi:hypothetical protein BYT27DRAFT_7191832 [Phlegmacium glaucopus]|nr:hypothetical protein BYT27DRAFT_7191832 [Phlegmacium glaucopus]